MESAAFTAMKIRAMIKLIEEDGWYLDRTRGSHRQYRHDQKKGVVTIAGKPSDDLAAGRKIVSLNKQD
jgi:predicted RNA binding protein YcfA (HicA-like mRNA interferase family)